MADDQTDHRRADCRGDLRAEGRAPGQARAPDREATDAAGGAYPVSVPVTDTIPAVRARHEDLEADVATGDIVGVAGRVVHLRNTGKLCFAALQSGDGARIQAMVSLAEVGEE